MYLVIDLLKPQLSELQITNSNKFTVIKYCNIIKNIFPEIFITGAVYTANISGVSREQAEGAAAPPPQILRYYVENLFNNSYYKNMLVPVVSQRKKIRNNPENMNNQVIFS